MKEKYLSEKTTNRILFILALVGVAIALYVTQSFLRKTPIVCLNSGCELVRKNPASYIAGIPVPAFGLVGYAILVILTFLRTTSNTLHKKLLPWIVGITGGGVLFVSWFTYTEAFVIGGFCTWCVVSAGNMVTMFALSLNSYKNNR
ncbi:MAG: vitamin K epoxide reductase family protein [Patescibacteria group bacterium]